MTESCTCEVSSRSVFRKKKKRKIKRKAMLSFKEIKRKSSEAKRKPMKQFGGEVRGEKNDEMRLGSGRGPYRCQPPQ